MKISIVIPAYNEEKYVAKTLETICSLPKKNWEVEVIVVDASSTDQTEKIAKDFGARVINVAHRGIGFARQQGLMAAKGDIVFITDADTQVPSNWLTEHVASLSQEKVVLTFGGYRVYDGRRWYIFMFNHVYPFIIGILYKFFYWPISSGQNMAFWKDKALQIGGFDQKLLLMEDTDLSIRMKKIGKVVYLPDNLIYTSGRRGNEGFQYYLRYTKAFFQYYILRKRNLDIFPDIR